jgi:type IV pilus assembly protein PilA
MKRILKKFRYGEKGFTLIELLVVIAILGVLAAVAVPNISSFLGKGETEAMETEWHNVETAILAAMVDAGATAIAGTAPHTLDATHDIDIDGTSTVYVGDYISGDVASLAYTYSISADGSIASQT